jgi:hypothetical protein
MVRCRCLLLLAALVLPLLSCVKKGDECSTCSSSEDCKSGLVCSRFADGKMRCGSGVGATICGR